MREDTESRREDRAATPAAREGGGREATDRERTDTGVWSIPGSRWGDRVLRRDARRDVAVVRIGGCGVNETPRMLSCFGEYRASATHERLTAAREIGHHRDELVRLVVDLGRAEEERRAAAEASGVSRAAVGPLAGEESMPSTQLQRRLDAEQARRAAEARNRLVRASVVRDGLEARINVLAEQIRARVRLAQAGGMAAYHHATRKVLYYAEHLVRRHPHGATLVQLGWPHPLPEPETWLTDEDEALHLICGNAPWMPAIEGGAA